jgi:uncharacterized membrane protein
MTIPPPSRTAWAIGFLTLSAAALAAPALQSNHHALAALVLREFFIRLCHQRPERSLTFAGFPVAICARCLGVYVGAAFGCLLRLRRQSALWIFVTVIVLNAADVAAESATLHPGIAWMRLILGTLLGIGTGALLTSSDAEMTLRSDPC